MATTTNCGCGGCINVLAEAGAVVNVGCCGDSTTGTGDSSPNGLIFNALATCETDGSLTITWETLSPNEVITVTLDGSPVATVDNTATLPDWDGVGEIIIGVDGSETEIVSLTHEACEAVAVQPVLLLGSCYADGAEIRLTWNNPDGVLFNLYRANDETLLVGPTSALTQYVDVLPLPNVNSYELRRDGDGAVIASTSFDFNDCAAPPVGVCTPTLWHDWRDSTPETLGDTIHRIEFDGTHTIVNRLSWTITGLPSGYTCIDDMKYQTWSTSPPQALADVAPLSVYTVSAAASAELISATISGTTATIVMDIINDATNGYNNGHRGIRPVALYLGTNA